MGLCNESPQSSALERFVKLSEQKQTYIYIIQTNSGQANKGTLMLRLRQLQFKRVI